MAIYVKNNNSFEQTETASRECPHCGAFAQLIPFATPSFEALQRARPRYAGLVFRCANCNEARFVRASVRRFDIDQIELSSNLVEVERARERFKFGYLPATVEILFREALDCYTADCLNAFASMCRRTMQAALEDARRHEHPNLADLFRDVARLSEIDARTSDRLEAVLFSSDREPPTLDADQAAVLIEIVKDMLYQCFVRTAKLKAAMKMRRYFASESMPKVTPIDSRSRQAETG